MSKETVYILHKNGAPSHYLGLQDLLHRKDIRLKHREFSIISKLIKTPFKKDWKGFTKQWINLFFLLKLLFSKNEKVVLGIAPHDSKLSRLSSILKNHQVYYHTSWCCWDQTFQPKEPKSLAILDKWKSFLEKQTTHIFAVSPAAKESLLKNYNLKSEMISVVYHTIHPDFLKVFSPSIIPKSFIYYGRMLPQKGIDELLNFFKDNKESTLTLIGDGSEAEVAIALSRKFPNINYHASITDRSELAHELSKHEFLILNSKRTKKWEELFGMVIIEAMAQGVTPIATAHAGPRSIITKEIGYLYQEGELAHTLNTILANKISSRKDPEVLKIAAQKYTMEEISQLWKPILN